MAGIDLCNADARDERKPWNLLASCVEIQWREFDPRQIPASATNDHGAWHHQYDERFP